MLKKLISMIYSFYGPKFAVLVVQQMKLRWYDMGNFLAWLWSNKRLAYGKKANKFSVIDKFLVLIFYLMALGVIVCAIKFFQVSRWQLAVAILVIYPLLVANLLALLVSIYRGTSLIVRPKKLFRNIVCFLLERKVVKLRERHNFTIIAVAGSVGKTSTKMSIVQLLQNAGIRTMYQKGNYNDRVTVPLAIFGLTLDGLFNPFNWFNKFRYMRKFIKTTDLPFDVAVVELGSDGPGQMQKFSYLNPEIAVLTAISPEHMEFFKDMSEVAREESAILGFAKKAIVNIDSIDDSALEFMKGYDYDSYSLKNPDANFFVKSSDDKNIEIKSKSLNIKVTKRLLGEQGLLITLASVATTSILGLTKEKIIEGTGKLESFSGRMNLLSGKKDSIIIDDTYNASPLAVKAAIDVLYSYKSSHRIAVLGDMNELGADSPKEHRAIGDYCDPKKLDYVVTIGPESKKYLAPRAIANNCTVKSFLSPVEAGNFVLEMLKRETVILVKGSQNRVFAEEATKVLLKNKADFSKLVRQSEYWLDKKYQQFDAQ